MSPTGHEEKMELRQLLLRQSSTLREDIQQEEQGWTPSLGTPVLCPPPVHHTHSPVSPLLGLPRGQCHNHFITPHRDTGSTLGCRRGSHVYLQVPDLDLSPWFLYKNESIRVELRTGESCGGDGQTVRAHPLDTKHSKGKAPRCSSSSLGQHYASTQQALWHVFFLEQMSNN